MGAIEKDKAIRTQPLKMLIRGAALNACFLVPNQIPAIVEKY